MKPMVLLTAILLIAGTILVAGCVQQPAGPPATATPTTATTTIPTATPVPPVDSIGVANTTSLGPFLVDARGMTLYYFTKDSPGTGNSSCYNQCVAIWPAFHVTTIRVSPPLSAADFGEITRTTGDKQTTFQGWPLYYYQNDTAPGDARGQGFNNLWFVVSPAGVVTVSPTTPPTTIPTTVRTTTVRTTIPDSGSDSGSGGGGY
jgi:predicted lipoprotein with Yx(FWY)xxD motif